MANFNQYLYPMTSPWLPKINIYIYVRHTSDENHAFPIEYSFFKINFISLFTKKHNTNKKAKLKYVWFTKTYIRLLQQ